jgi:hypothetical protein
MRRRVDLAGLERESRALQAALAAVSPSRRRPAPDAALPRPDPREHLAWLQGFAARALDTPAQRDTAARECAVFCSQQNSWSRQWAQQWAVGGGSTLDFTKGIRAAQTAVRKLLGDLRSGEVTWLARPLAYHGLVWRRQRITLVTRATGLGQFRAALVDFLVTIGPRLRCCASAACGRFFLPTHGRQRHCDKACGNRQRQRAWRRVHRRRLSDVRHDQYRKRQRARLGPNVQVHRRARPDQHGDG